MIRTVVVGTKFFFVLFITLLLTSCIKKTPICSKFDQMVYLDQKYRSDIRANPIAKIADSLRIINNSQDSENYIEKAYKLYEDAPVLRNYHFKGFVDERLSDSLFKLQTVIDSQNILFYSDFFEAIPKTFTDTSSCFKKSIIIMTHCPNSMKPKFKKLFMMNKYRFSENEFNYVIGALNK